MRCPKCYGTDISLVGNTHYICNNPTCTDNGARIQFKIINDTKIQFPYNQIFIGRRNSEFYRKEYIRLGSLGVTETNR